jgi:hypothetical protein
MKFDELLSIVQDESVFDTTLILCGDVDPADVRRQLSRWTSSGRLYQLRRGLYSLAPPFQKVRPDPFVIANHLVRPSYISLQSALSFYGLIPEAVPVTTSVTTGRPGFFSTPLGDFLFRHIQVPLFRGFDVLEPSGRQPAFVAIPEKALLDLLYLEPGSDHEAFLSELRLDLEGELDMDRLESLSLELGRRKVARAVEILIRRHRDAAGEYEAA